MASFWKKAGNALKGAVTGFVSSGGNPGGAVVGGLAGLTSGGGSSSSGSASAATSSGGGVALTPQQSAIQTDLGNKIQGFMTKPPTIQAARPQYGNVSLGKKLTFGGSSPTQQQTQQAQPQVSSAPAARKIVPAKGLVGVDPFTNKNFFGLGSGAEYDQYGVRGYASDGTPTYAPGFDARNDPRPDKGFFASNSFILEPSGPGQMGTPVGVPTGPGSMGTPVSADYTANRSSGSNDIVLPEIPDFENTAGTGPQYSAIKRYGENDQYAKKDIEDFIRTSGTGPEYQDISAGPSYQEVKAGADDGYREIKAGANDGYREIGSQFSKADNELENLSSDRIKQELNADPAEFDAYLKALMERSFNPMKKAFEEGSAATLRSNNNRGLAKTWVQDQDQAANTKQFQDAAKDLGLATATTGFEMAQAKKAAALNNAMTLSGRQNQESMDVQRANMERAIANEGARQGWSRQEIDRQIANESARQGWSKQELDRQFANQDNVYKFGAMEQDRQKANQAAKLDYGKFEQGQREFDISTDQKRQEANQANALKYADLLADQEKTDQGFRLDYGKFAQGQREFDAKRALDATEADRKLGLSMLGRNDAQAREDYLDSIEEQKLNQDLLQRQIDNAYRFTGQGIDSAYRSASLSSDNYWKEQQAKVEAEKKKQDDLAALVKAASNWGNWGGNSIGPNDVATY